MRLASEIPDLPASAVRQCLEGLPDARGYDVLIKALRYRSRPHLAAWTDFQERTITLQIPQPFLPFGEVIPYAARRLPGKGLRFAWLSEGLTFRQPREVLRFLYLHEWMHWWLRERRGQRSRAETACDRFALLNFRKAVVTVDDARAALTRSSR